MTPDQFNELQNFKNVISAEDIPNREVNRTLLYGYDMDRRTHHVYLEDGRLHLYVYNDKRYLHLSGVFEVSTLIPNKRLYPEACDFEFCRFLQMGGVNLPFTTFGEDRPKVHDGQYYGKIW